MASDLPIDGEARSLWITLLCGVQKSPSQPCGRSQHSTPHFRRRHITHQMWRATFDAGNPHVRVCEGWGRQRPHLLGMSEPLLSTATPAMAPLVVSEANCTL